MVQVILDRVDSAGRVPDLVAKVKALMPRLAGLDVGQKLVHGDLRLETLQREGNQVVVVEEVGGGGKYVVKFPSDSPGSTLDRELSQWSYLASLPEALHGALPRLVAGDREVPLVLVEHVRSVTCHGLMKWLPALLAVPGARASVRSRFERLGEQLGTLHGVPPPGDLPPVLEPVASRLELLASRTGRDETLASGLAAWQRARQPAALDAWVHGNLRGDNVLLAGDRVVLIDLERAGSGDPMGDLGRFVAFMLMFRRLPLYPRGLWREMLASLLSGYRSRSRLVPEALATAVLGEVLFLYGREYVLKPVRGRRRLEKPGLERIIRHLARLVARSSGSGQELLSRLVR